MSRLNYVMVVLASGKGSGAINKQTHPRIDQWLQNERRAHARIQRWGQGSGHPENHKNIEFLSNTDPDPLKNHKATKPTLNVGPSSARQRNAI